MKGFAVMASLALVLGMAINTAEAHPRVFSHNHHKHVVVKKEVVVRPAPVRNLAGYVVVKPVSGVRIATLPRGYTTVRVDGRTLYRYNHVTYRRVNNYYIVV